MAPPEAANALISAISALSKRIGIPASLGALGFPRADLPAVLADALTYRNRAASPRAFTDEELGDLLEKIY
jgi:alcohol dehydrogenase class IV